MTQSRAPSPACEAWAKDFRAALVTGVDQPSDAASAAISERSFFIVSMFTLTAPPSLPASAAATIGPRFLIMVGAPEVSARISMTREASRFRLFIKDKDS